MYRTKLAAFVGGLLIAWTTHVATQSGAPRNGEWREYGGDQGCTKYSPLDQINKDNVSRAAIAWRRPAVDRRNPRRGAECRGQQLVPLDADHGRRRALLP